MNKQDKIKTILEKLLSKTKKTGSFNRREINSAIATGLFILDERTVDKWFQLLWKLEIFTQPQPNKFSLDWTRLTELEINALPELNPNQRRLL